MFIPFLCFTLESGLLSKKSKGGFYLCVIVATCGCVIGPSYRCLYRIRSRLLSSFMLCVLPVVIFCWLSSHFVQESKKDNKINQCARISHAHQKAPVNWSKRSFTQLFLTKDLFMGSTEASSSRHKWSFRSAVVLWHVWTFHWQTCNRPAQWQGENSLVESSSVITEAPSAQDKLQEGRTLSVFI